MVEVDSTGVTAPTVSVGLPVYNGERYVAEAIESILGQTWRDLELIICDNASTDATEQICRGYARRDARVRYERADANVGLARNFNRCVELARGRYFKWLPHDDLCRPTFIERCVEAYTKGPQSTVLVYPTPVFIDEHGAIIAPDNSAFEAMQVSPRRRFAVVMRRVLHGNPHLGVLRTSVLRRTRGIGGFPASDYVLNAELALLGRIRRLPEPLMLRRLHETSSRRRNPSREMLTRWLDPSASGGRFGVVTPTLLRLLIEYRRSVRRLVPGRWDRIACYATIVEVFVRRRVRTIGGRILAVPRRAMRRRGCALHAPG